SPQNLDLPSRRSRAPDSTAGKTVNLPDLASPSRRGIANMRESGLSKRAREGNDAQAEVDAAFAEVVKRNDVRDPRTIRWNEAIAAWREALDRAYPEALRQVRAGEKPLSALATVDILDFLEADPFFFGSGYMKEKLLTEIKRRALDRHEVLRLQSII